MNQSNGRITDFTLLLLNVTGVHLQFTIFANEILFHQFEKEIDFITAGVEKLFNHDFNVMCSISV
jgi:hypothetical protein